MLNEILRVQHCTKQEYYFTMIYEMKKKYLILLPESEFSLQNNVKNPFPVFRFFYVYNNRISR